MSKQSELILSIVDSCDGHMTADQVFQEARKTLPRISIGTVYRNLTQLDRLGHIREVALPGEASRYERRRKLHGHLLCIRCGKIEDLPLPEMEALTGNLKTELISCSLCIRHICRDCAKNSLKR